MCDLCLNFNEEVDTNIKKYDVNTYLCKNCIAYCDKCECYYAEHGYCECADISYVLDTIEERIEIYNDRSISLDSILNAILVNVITASTMEGTDTKVWFIGDYVILLTNDEAKNVMASQGKYGIKHIANPPEDDFEDYRSAYIAPYLKEVPGEFVNFLEEYDPSTFGRYNTFFTYTYWQKLVDVHTRMLNEDDVDQDYIDFVSDMIKICKGVTGDYVMSDLRPMNVRMYNEKPIPYDVIYVFANEEVCCEKCKDYVFEEGYEYNNRIYCDNCTDQCSKCDCVMLEADKFVSYDNEIYCESCYFEEYTVCDECGEETKIFETIKVDSITYCEVCHEAEFEFKQEEVCA